MKLYIGGAYQGQAELAKQENPNAEIIYDFLELAGNSGDPREFARQFAKTHAGSVIVADEVGSGIVPIDSGERLFREKAGRALCVIAQECDSVTRVVCGIGVRLK